MYVRQAKQFLRNAIEGFDERKYGFASVVDLLRAAGKEGVLRVERDRQGAVRVFPGANLTPRAAAPIDQVFDDEESDADTVDVNVPLVAEPVADPPIVDAEAVVAPMEDAVTTQEEQPAQRGGRKRKTATTRGGRAPKAAKTARPRARKAARPKSDAQKA
jgi:hypothetical protein